MENIWEEFDALNRTVNRQAKLVAELEKRLEVLEFKQMALEAQAGTAPEEKRAA